jgi:preprotein translocase subunit YajC
MKNEIKVGDEVTVNGVWGVVDQITQDGYFAIDQDGKDFFVKF